MLVWGLCKTSAIGKMPRIFAVSAKEVPKMTQIMGSNTLNTPRDVYHFLLTTMQQESKNNQL